MTEGAPLHHENSRVSGEGNSGASRGSGAARGSSLERGRSPGGSQAPRWGRRRCQGADPRRRTRQGRRRQGRQEPRRSGERRQTDHRHAAGHAPDRPPGAEGAARPDRAGSQDQARAVPRNGDRPLHRASGNHGQLRRRRRDREGGGRDARADLQGVHPPDGRPERVPGAKAGLRAWTRRARR